MLNILLLEINSIDALEMQSMIRELDHRVLGVVRSVHEALQFIDRTKPDLLIANAYLPGQASVAEFTKTMADKDIPTIMISNRDHSDRGRYQELRQQHQPIGYLVKPFHQLTLASTIDLLVSRRLEAIQNASLFVKSALNDRIRVDYESIVFVQSEGNYIYIQTTQKRYALKRTLKSMLPELDHRFVQVHSRYIVNRQQVTVVNGVALVVNGHKLPIGRRYKQSLYQTLQPAVNEKTELAQHFV